MPKPILSCAQIGVRFGGVQALSEVSFTAQQGQITSIIGPNGAGKTTLLNIISGLVTAQEGTLVFNGQDITHSPSHLRAGLGMIRTFQNLEIFSNMSVLDNVAVGAHSQWSVAPWQNMLRTPKAQRVESKIYDQARTALEFVGLEPWAEHDAQDLAFGQQRLLELARALAAQPQLLLLDEPAAGLNIAETQALAELIVRMAQVFKLSVILVEHDMDLVMSISQSIMVLCFGQVLCHGTPGQVQKDPQVIAAYLGAED